MGQHLFGILRAACCWRQLISFPRVCWLWCPPGCPGSWFRGLSAVLFSWPVGFFPLQDPWGHSPCSWCPDVPAMAPWANPLNCWPTASKLKSQRLMSTSMRWISNQISVLGGWTGEKIHLSCKLYHCKCWMTTRVVKGRISFLLLTSQLGGESAAAHSAWRGSQYLSSSWSTLG